LKQKSGYPSDRAIFWHFPHTYDQPAYSSVRQGDWKLIYWHATRTRELFNLKDDIGEQQALAAKQPQELKELSAVLGGYLRDCSAVMPTDKQTGKPVAYPDQL
jgi:hypothetical protein